MEKRVRELERRVQELEDLFEKKRREYDDLLSNLDEKNFSTEFLDQLRQSTT